MDNQNDFLTPQDDSNSKNKKGSIIILILGIVILIFAVVVTIILIKAISSMVEKPQSTTAYTLTSSVGTVSETDDDYINEVLGISSQTNVASSVDANDDNNPTTPADIIKDTTKNALIESYEHLSKNGDNYLSDHYENEYIALVESEYGIDPDLLVAIYSVPDTGTNFVLQFSGAKNKNDEIVKSPDTLEKVYQIDLDKNIKVATGTNKGNVGVSYPESVMSFNMVKVIVMEQYPDYFTGLKGD